MWKRKMRSVGVLWWRWEAATPPPSFWISFAGFISLFLHILIIIFIALVELFNNNELGSVLKLDSVILYSFLLTSTVGFFVGPPMIVGGGMRVSQQFVRSCALFSITTLPPLMSFVFTFFKLKTIFKFATPTLDHYAEQRNAEANEQDLMELYKSTIYWSSPSTRSPLRTNGFLRD